MKIELDRRRRRMEGSRGLTNDGGWKALPASGSKASTRMSTPYTQSMLALKNKGPVQSREQLLFYFQCSAPWDGRAQAYSIFYVILNVLRMRGECEYGDSTPYSSEMLRNNINAYCNLSYIPYNPSLYEYKVHFHRYGVLLFVSFCHAGPRQFGQG